MRKTASVPDHRPAPRLLRVKDVCELLGIGRSTLYDRLKDSPDFPVPVRIVGSALRWPEPEIRDWIERRIEAERASAEQASAEQ